jgi:hydroxyacylglutathione hydrolase
MKVKSFTFNPFQENTYILYNEEKQAFIIDPGMYFPEEFDQFFQFIEMNQLEPTMLLNTHTHLDHVFANAAVLNRFKIPFAYHELDKPVFDSANSVGKMYGLSFEPSPAATFYLNENEQLQLGKDQFSMMLTPGHSPGSVCFYNKKSNFVISGDVLFQQSIGRTDLPGGDYETLIQSIRTELFVLPDETLVYSGHGPATTIGSEKRNNPFLRN